MKYNEIRRKTRKIRIANTEIGGDSRIAIQSMTNTDTHDKLATLTQIKALENAGCDIVRITVPDIEAADTITYLKENGVRIPVVADIHFDYRVALRCAELGVDKIRINPGNIGDDDRVRAVVDACKKNNIPIRIGVNGGSLEKHILAKYGAPTPEALCESALYHVSLLEKFDFYDTVISMKISDPYKMILANRLLADKCDYPLHLGVTEAGARERGMLKSAVGIGALLCDGIGDTVRVSLTDDPIEEIRAARAILQSVGIEGQAGLDIVSCPTCGRTKIDLIPLVASFEEAAKKEGLLDMPLKVAIMGCVVNGPGEAREADVGIAGGKGEAVLIRKGEIVRKISESDIVECLISEIKKIRDGE
ncbi:MAG: flavodoxin-dependent (E)-4-hydroxy-3-methylbut-2-enyl-diphosphate synthase [Ruminococcaceae bacterium]|nr:flavodoxin-dependent (E)-4-hydroxy-3-methylbut-2-enyl-diphosphate synthase [Oscillospiraceae bacterium]